MMRVVALDLSLTATGWASCNGAESGRASGLVKPRGRGVYRLQNALDQVLGVSAGAQLALIEGYSYGARHVAHQLGELGGVIRLGLRQRSIPFVEVPPAVIKKLATGAGNASKELVLVEAVKRLGYQGADNNIADALWLLAMAQIHYGLPGAPELPKKHLAGMKKVEWPELG